MGKILAVWSDTKKSGKSIITYMLANKIVEGKKLKVLVCCLNLKYSSLYRLYGIEPSETGLEDLVNCKLYQEKREALLEEMIPKYGDMYFLGTYRTTNRYAQRNEEGFRELFQGLKEFFDLIIVDTVSGKENTLTNLVLKKADMVLKLFNQDNESLRGIRQVREEQVPYQQETVYLLSKYTNIYPRATDIKRRLGLTKLYTMEYCETLQEMKNRDSLHLYLQRETACNRSVEKITASLLEALGIAEEDYVVKNMVSNKLKEVERFFRRVGTAGSK